MAAETNRPKRRIARIIYAFAAAGVFCHSPAAFSQGSNLQPWGAPPPVSLNATDLYTAYRLPPLRDQPDGALETLVSGLQVGNRAGALKLSGHSSIDAWNRAQSLMQDLNRVPPSSYGTPLLFSGATASELNRLLVRPEITSIQVTAPIVTVDEPIRIGHSHVLLNLTSTVLVPLGSYPYVVIADGFSDAVVAGGFITSGQSGILVNKCDHVTVRGVQIQGLGGAGIVVTHSTYTTISDSHISGVTGAGVILHGGSASGVIERNEISGNLGWSNMTAGIVVTDRNVDLTFGPGALLGPDGYFVVVAANRLSA